MEQTLHKMQGWISNHSHSMKNGLENLAKSKNFSIVFDYYVGSMLELAKNDCARLLLFAKTVLKEAGVILLWFSHVP